MKDNKAYAATFSLTLLEISKVSDLAERLHLSKSEVVRAAIDMYYHGCEYQTEEEEPVEP